MAVITVDDVESVRFSAPDLPRMRAFLIDFGMTPAEDGGDGVLRMRGTGSAPFIHETVAGAPGFVALVLRAASRADLDTLAAAEGIAVEPAPGPGGGSRVVLADPDGFRVEVVAGKERTDSLGHGVRALWNTMLGRHRPSEPKRVSPGAATVARLGHVVLGVSDTAASWAWYRDRFGLIMSDEVRAPNGDLAAAFIRCDRGDDPADHHTLNFASIPGRPAAFHHAAFEVADFDDLMAGHEHLKGAGIPRCGASAATSSAVRCSTIGRTRGVTRSSTGPTATISPPTSRPASPTCRRCSATSGGRLPRPTSPDPRRAIKGHLAMKLVRFRGDNGPRLGVMRDDAVVPLDALHDTWPTMLAIVAGGDAALDAVRACAERGAAAVALDAVRLLAPIEQPGKFLAIGMNYRRHAEEAKKLGIAVPTQQFWFNKQTSCLSGPYDDIDRGVSEQVDYEVELGVVIGRPAKGVSEADARGHVFGYTVMNDVSARDWQRHSPTFTVGKSFDTHGPLGPWIVTADEIADPHALRLRCWVNGELRQNSDTSELIYDIWQQIAYLSTAFTLHPGDLLATGTPEGVGVARQPPVFLKPGDVVRCEVEGIGAIENRVG